MIKFQDLKKEDYEPIVNISDNSQVHFWIKSWIVQGVEKHPKQDFSQASFQKYLNTCKNVPEDCTAYNIIKKFRDEKDYEVLKKIRLVVPNNNLPKKEKAEEEVDLSEIVLEESPKIITENQPQRIVVHDSVEMKAPTLEKTKTKLVNEKSGKVGWIISICIIIAIAAIVYLKACV